MTARGVWRGAAVDDAKFMILSGPRTGSNMLVEALNSDRRIVCFREIFNFAHDVVDYAVEGYEDRARGDDAIRRQAPARFLRECVFSGHARAVRAVGFKLHYDHVWGYERLDRVLAADRDLRIIHLKRRNLLRSLVSRHIAQRTQRWFEYAPEPSLASRLSLATLVKSARDPGRALVAIRRKLRTRSLGPARAEEAMPVVVGVEECWSYFARMEHEYRFWAEVFAGHPMIDSTYEALVTQRNSEIGAIQQFLGIEPGPVVIGLVPQNPAPLQDLVANFDELREAFAGTKYAAFVEG